MCVSTESRGMSSILEVLKPTVWYCLDWFLPFQSCECAIQPGGPFLPPEASVHAVLLTFNFPEFFDFHSIILSSFIKCFQTTRSIVSSNFQVSFPQDSLVSLKAVRRVPRTTRAISKAQVGKSTNHRSPLYTLTRIGATQTSTSRLRSA